MGNELLKVLDEYNSLGIKQQLDYDKFYLYSIITHSTAIEGSTITEVENQLLFDEGVSANKPMPEQLMNLDLKAAYEESFSLAKNHIDFSIELLCKLAGLVMKNTGSTYKTIAGEFSSAKGELRLLNVSAGHGGKSYLAWQKVADKLEMFCNWINEERKKINKSDIQKIYELSFEAHYRIASIHPWADGNGRMSRLIMNMIQYETGVIPSIVKKEKRAEYIQSLSQSQDAEDSAAFIDFMMNHHIENLKQQIIEYKKSMETDLTDNKQKGSEKKFGDNKKTSEIILELLKDNPKLSAKNLSEIIGITSRAVEKQLASLVEKGYIKREGSPKGGHWEVLK